MVEVNCLLYNSSINAADADYQEPQSDDESDNEDVPDLRGDGNFWLIGCKRLDKDLIRKWNLWLIIYI